MPSDGIYVDSYDDERECKYCEGYEEVEVHFDPEAAREWWTCPDCGGENDKFLDEWDQDPDFEEDYE